MATYILARAFKFAVRQIAIIFDRESLGEYLSLSLLERRIQKAEKAERIVKALEKDAGDEEHQKAIEIIKQCKKLPVIVREWPLRKEDVNYFIESMDTIVAILKLLCEGEDLCKVSLVNEWFCKTETGWHKPPSFSQVNLL
jgi:hypothetical protein